MTEKRTVECLDCGYRWESSASDPRCSQSECGRSRNVEAVNGEPDEQDAEDESSTTTEQEIESDSTSTEDTSTEDTGSDGGFTPAFESHETTTSDSETTAEAPSLDSTSTESEDDSTSTDESDEQDEASDGPDPAEDIPEIDPEQLEVAFEVTFDAVAARRGDHWELGDGEAEKLGKAWSPVANEYAPILFREHTAVGVALVATVSVLMPRLAKDRELAELAERQERAERDGEPGEERSPTPGSIEGEPDPAEDASTWPDEQPDEQTADAGGYANV